MSRLLTDILNLSVIIAAVIALIRFRRISAVYLPFLWLVWIGCFNEVFSIFIVSLGYYNIYNFNLFQLAESLLVLWQFRRWRLFEKESTYTLFAAAFLAVYLADNLFLTGFHFFNSYFRIFYSFTIVLLSIRMLNSILITERGSLLKNPAFLICSAFILFFTFATLTEVFWLYGQYLNREFRTNMQRIFYWVNMFCNLVYALAILWMPKRQAFSLPY